MRTQQRTFKDGVTASLRETGDRMSGSGGGTVWFHRTFIDDIVRRCERFYREPTVKLAVAILPVVEDGGGDSVDGARAHNGLLVVVDGDLVLAREMSGKRTRYGIHPVSDLTAESIAVRVANKHDAPGLRLRSHTGGQSFALGLWNAHRSAARPLACESVRDRLVALINEPSIAETALHVG